MYIKQRLTRLIRKIPLQAIFVIPFVVQIVLIVGLTGYLSFRNGQQAVNTLVSELQSEVTQRISERLDQYLTVPHLLNHIASHTIESGQIDLDDPESTLPYFWQNLYVFEELNATFLGTEEGVLVGARRLTDRGIEVMLASEATGQSLNYYRPDEQGFATDFVTGASDYDPRERGWYMDALATGKPRWSPIYLDFATGMLVITAGQPIYDGVGEPLGVIGSAFQFEQVNDFLQQLEIGENGQTFIMDREGLFVSTSTEAPIGKPAGDTLTRLQVADSENVIERTTAVALQNTYGDLRNIQDVAELELKIEGEDYYIRVTPMHDEYGLDWLVAVIMPISDFMAEIQANNHITIVAIVVALISAVIIGFITTNWVTRPLLQLRDTAIAFSEGKWEERVTINREGELGHLAITFNQMADQLQESFSLMEQSQARYESMFNYVPIMLLEEDFSDVKKYLTELEKQGVTDLDTYLADNHDVLIECIQRIKILTANQTVLKVRNVTLEEVAGPLMRGYPAEEYDVVRRELVTFASGETHFESETTIIDGDGRRRQVYLRLAIVPGYEESWARVLASVEDITQRLEMENALRQSEQRLKSAQRMARVGDWEYDIDSDLISWSEEVFHLFERPQHLGPPTYEENLAYYLPEDGEKLERQVGEAIETGEPTADTYRIQLPSGRIAHHASTIYPILNDDGRCHKLTGTVQDITERVMLEEQIQSQERLAAVGQLAAGIAHDFNNILSSITLYTDLLQRTLPDLSAKNQKRLQTIANQTERATKLIQQILDFSRQSPLQRSPMNIRQSLGELVDMLQRTLPETIKLKFKYGQSIYMADIDPTRFQQVFMNLAVNARDAMPDGGELTFTITNYHLSADDPPPVVNMPVGDWIKIQVTDTGLGIDTSVLPRIFDPFFTTKPPGKGTGLGLAQVYGIITQHDGFIIIDSEKQDGTTFTIFLPALSQDIKMDMGLVTITDEIGHGETILIVEDDDLTREALVMALEDLHYTTIVATNGREGLAIIKEATQQIDMVLSDMLMPEMNGLELISIMRQQGIDLPVAILSGYVLEDDLETMQQLGVVGWLYKPPNLKQLAVLLHRGLSHAG